MCNSTSSAVIDQVLSEFIAANRAFTALEVSRETQQRVSQQGHQVERHGQMKNYIHKCPLLTDAKEFGNYTQTTVTVGVDNGQSLQAFLYHPRSYDVTQYQPLSRQGSTGNVTIPLTPLTLTPPSIGVPVSNLTTSGVSSPNSDPFMLDHRSRLNIPTQYLRDIGLAAKDTVYLFGENNALFLTKTEPVGKTNKALRVEKDGDIRISQSNLIDAGLDANEFDVIVEQDVNQNSVVKIVQAV